jgi:hypothetical protein
MEDVLDVYCRPYDPRRPLICMDEMGKNLVKDKHPAEDMKPGQPRREDYTYEKKGASNVFIACEPLVGKRSLKVSRQRTKKDWAHFLKELLTEHSPQAEKVVLVMDNLKTHSPASLYEVFPPQEAKALADRLEIHYPQSTPAGSTSPKSSSVSWSVKAWRTTSRRSRRSVTRSSSGKPCAISREPPCAGSLPRLMHVSNWSACILSLKRPKHSILL